MLIQLTGQTIMSDESLGEDVPPTAEWRDILSPLRIEEQRRYALPTSFVPDGWSAFGIIWLRTCYDEGSDALHAALLDKLNIELALDVKENILDDPDLYDWNDDWHKIFEIMPERLFGILIDHDSSAESYAAEHNEKLDHHREAFKRKHKSGDGMDVSSLRTALPDFRFWSIVGYLFVADRLALDSGKALVVFFDQCGRTVCHARIQADLCEDTAGAWADGHIIDQPEFYEAELGPDYLPGGVCGPPFA